MDNLIIEFAEKKVNVAKRLYCGECGGSYSDAMLILSSAISGIASLVWPSEEGVDRKRFVELLTWFANPELRPCNISVPLLIYSLEKKGNVEDAQSLRRYLPHSSAQIITGDDVDRAEDEILKICPGLRVSDIRKESYANVFYRQVRSGVVHEYQLGDLADPHQMTSRKSYVSYSNYAYPRNHRKIVFSFEWAEEAMKSVATAIRSSDNLPFPPPTKWWLEGR